MENKSTPALIFKTENNEIFEIPLCQVECIFPYEDNAMFYANSETLAHIFKKTLDDLMKKTNMQME